MENTSPCASETMSDASPQLSIDVDQLQSFVAQQVEVAMDKFCAMYTKAFGQLELVIFQDLLPRLPSSPANGHLRVVRRVLRRLDRLRPFVLNSQRESYEKIIKNWKRAKDNHKKGNSSESDSKLILSDDALRPPECTPCDSSNEPLPMKKSIDRKRIELIYKNQLFPLIPASLINLPTKHGDFIPLSLSKNQLPDSSTESVPVGDAKHCESETRLLQVSVMQHNSYFSIHLERQKFPAIWKYFNKQKFRKQVSKNRIPLSGRRLNFSP